MKVWSAGPQIHCPGCRRELRAEVYRPHDSAPDELRIPEHTTPGEDTPCLSGAKPLKLVLDERRRDDELLEVQQQGGQPEWMSRKDAVAAVPAELREAVAALGPGERVQAVEVLVCFPAFAFAVTDSGNYILWQSGLGPTAKELELKNHLNDIAGGWSTEPKPGEVWLGLWENPWGPPSDDYADNFGIRLLHKNPVPATDQTT